MAVEFMEFEVDGDGYEGRLNAPEDGDAARCVVVLPGAGHGPFGDVFDVAAYELANAGVATFRFETWTDDAELDAKTLDELYAERDAAIAFARERGYDDVSLLVKSFGARFGLTDFPEAVERVLGWAPAVVLADDSNLDAVADQRLGDVEEMRIGSEDVADVDVPVRLLYGDDDPYYPGHAEALADVLPDVELRVLEGENHSMNARRHRVLDETVAFLADDARGERAVDPRP